ncbi:hypothetical protein HQ393_07110 [Chitinibacter bivalviorum]|uniref:Uncharacterized protein n=1 Tax=Chitinibacter bivalviorum TaxID=2739434 RepID=A0A7H9BHE0_9NEIS|nr:hypothetical protein [Chitinibacter bivalviorum]QLG88047.1 hypothetical protein HQ393_07110 [Chitinibacter bivalviorum]
MKERYHSLNLQPDFNPLDPTQVSDPACWLIGNTAQSLELMMTIRFRLHQRGLGIIHEPPVGVWDLTIDDER